MLTTTLGVRQQEVMRLLYDRGPYFKRCGWSSSLGNSKTEEVLRRLTETGLVERDYIKGRESDIYILTLAGRIEAVLCRG